MKQKTATSMSGNTAEWGDVIMAEAAKRLPDIDGRISDSTSVYTDKDGNGVYLLVLNGSKSWIPAVIRNFDLKPIDIILAKKDKKNEAKYLSKRNLVKLLVTSTLGKPVGGSQGQFAISDVGINFLSPAGGPNAGSQSNPFFNMGKSKVNSFYDSDELDFTFNKSKVASEYARKELIKIGVLDDSVPKLNQNGSRFVTISKTASGTEFKAYTTDCEQGQIISTESVNAMLQTIPNEIDRKKKIASLMGHSHVLLGDFLVPKGNIFLKEQKAQEYSSDDAKSLTQQTPTMENVYMYGNYPTYINPHVKDIKGCDIDGVLAVRYGTFSYGNSYPHATNRTVYGPEVETKDKLLVNPERLESGNNICFYDERDNTVSEPFKFKVKKNNGSNISIVVEKLIGIPDTYTVTFGNIEEITKVNEKEYLYPSRYFKVKSLPNQFLNETYFNSESMESYEKLHDILITREDGLTYTVCEDGKRAVSMPESELFFKMLHRYGFSDNQALVQLRMVKEQLSSRFFIKKFMDNKLSESDFSLNKSDEVLLPKDKLAIDNTVKLIGLLKSANMSNLFSSSNYEYFEPLLDQYDKVVQKTASTMTGNTDSSQNADDRQEQSAAKSGLSQGVNNNQIGGGGLFQSLMMVNKVEKNTREIIDQLSYYALGKMKQEEKENIVNKLNSNLEDVEDYLCKIMLFSLLGAMPGVDYSELKILMSYIDSFLSSLKSFMVILG